jgi:hypothetical protein
MMLTLFTMLAIPSYIVAPFAGWVAFASFRDGEAKLGFKALGVFAVTATLILVAHSNAPKPTHSNRECYTDWDGFSNSEICE